jgi:hypothetical protein
MTLTADWPDDAVMSPFKIIGWQSFCSDIGCTSNTALRLCAKYEIPIISLSARKRGVLARDAMRLVRLRMKSAADYAAVRGAA